ncbi:MAG TPA: hypothetical protein VHV10_00995 [Ktedonobacteraceae bacterium]|nr:hypothetical protein [Ktedonobacteraceae bacterium]
MSPASEFSPFIPQHCYDEYGSHWMGMSFSHRDFNPLTFFWRFLVWEAMVVTEKNSVFPFTLA